MSTRYLPGGGGHKADKISYGIALKSNSYEPKLWKSEATCTGIQGWQQKLYVNCIEDCTM